MYPMLFVQDRVGFTPDVVHELYVACRQGLPYVAPNIGCSKNNIGFFGPFSRCCVTTSGTHFVVMFPSIQGVSQVPYVVHCLVCCAPYVVAPILLHLCPLCCSCIRPVVVTVQLCIGYIGNCTEVVYVLLYVDVGVAVYVGTPQYRPTYNVATTYVGVVVFSTCCCVAATYIGTVVYSTCSYVEPTASLGLPTVNQHTNGYRQKFHLLISQNYSSMHTTTLIQIQLQSFNYSQFTCISQKASTGPINQSIKKNSRLFINRIQLISNI